MSCEFCDGIADVILMDKNQYDEELLICGDCRSKPIGAVISRRLTKKRREQITSLIDELIESYKKELEAYKRIVKKRRRNVGNLKSVKNGRLSLKYLSLITRSDLK